MQFPFYATFRQHAANKAFKRSHNSWLFAPLSLILANYHLPLSGYYAKAILRRFNQ